MATFWWWFAVGCGTLSVLHLFATLRFAFRPARPAGVLGLAVDELLAVLACLYAALGVVGLVLAAQAVV